MPLELNDIIALRKRIAVDRARLEEEERALEVIERRLRMEQSAAPQPRLDLGEPRETKQTFAGAVRDAVNKFTVEEFDVPMIETLLKGMGVPLPEKYLRSRIAMEVQLLASQGAIRRTFQGKGSTPHRYRRVQE